MRKPALAVTAAALLVLGPVGAATATPPPPGPVTLAQGLVGPLHLSVGPGKSVTVSQEFASQLTTVSRGSTATLYDGGPDWDVSGVDNRGSTVYFLQSQGAGPDDPRPLVGVLKAIDARGNVSTVTDQIGAYETSVNPDSGNAYGLSAADAAANPGCVAQLTALGFPVSYTGEIDSHPYALTVVGSTAYVADAGINAVLAVNLHSGTIRTVAVLPPRPAPITAEAGAAFGLTDCVGLTYAFEPVPTDVEMGPDGRLYVSSLPGGPEDVSLGARGAVFRVAPRSGVTDVYAEGLMTPTGLTLDGRGNVYVASLFGEGVYKISARSHAVTVVLPATNAADVEIKGSTLYATTDAFGNGTLVSLRL